MKKSQQLVVRKVPSAPRPKPNSNPAKRMNLMMRMAGSLKPQNQPRRVPQPRQVSAPAAVATEQRGQAPMIQASRNFSRIIHREFLANITGTVLYTVAQSLALNPGLSASFPWLSTQAQGWETYKFNKLRFCYYTRTGTSVPGSVLLVPDYDAADAAPATEQVASTYEDISEDAPWKDICCELRRSAMHPSGPKKFVRSGALSPNLDVKTYDVGNLFVATVDGTAVSWGKLWVEYDVEFETPQLPPSGANSAAATLAAAGGSVAAATPFGAAPLTVNSNVVITPPTVAAPTVVNFSGLTVGSEYVITCGSLGTVISVYNLSAPTGLTVKTALGFNAINGAATSACAAATYTASATTGSITLTCTATTLTSADLTIASVPVSSF